MKSRIPEKTITPFLLDVYNHDAASVFAWDKYGNYGLVGFIGLNRRTRKIIHFTFSCRIMNMGIETFFLNKVLQLYPNLDISCISLKAHDSEWITLNDFNKPSVREKILKDEVKRHIGQPSIRVMANCQSASLHHYGLLGDNVEFDNWPRIFSLQQVLKGLHKKQVFPKICIYGAFNDYANNYWSEENRKKIDDNLYYNCAKIFLDYLNNKTEKLFVILPPIKISDEKFRDDLGVTKERTEKFNLFWSSFEKEYLFVKLFFLDSILSDEDVLDVRHFKPSGLQKIGSELHKFI